MRAALVFTLLAAFAQAATAFSGRGPDCNSEKPMSVEQFDAIADSGQVNGIEDLLRAIPEDSFTSYTFITNSLSAQKGEGASRVRPEFPRVLRQDITGNITWSWTCDPKDPAYNTVEMLYMKDGVLTGRSYRLNEPAGSRGPGRRIDPKPTSCISCHSTGVPVNGKLSMKHNWESYFNWSGCTDSGTVNAYGGNDDNMGAGEFRSGGNPAGCTGAQAEAFQTKQKTNYAGFRQMQKDNPCYNLLPHPDDPKKKVDGFDYSNYPYAVNSRVRNDDGQMALNVRANVNFNYSYSGQGAKRLKNLVTQAPNYDLIKYFIGLEGADCIETEDIEALNKLFPQLGVTMGGLPFANRDNPQTTTPILYAFTQASGMQPGDWSMNYKATEPNWNTGRDDYQMGELTSGEVLKSLAADDPSIPLPDSAWENTASADYGDRFACVDTATAQLGPKARGNGRELCQALRRKNIELVRDCLKNGVCPSSAVAAADPASQMAGLNDLIQAVRAETADPAAAAKFAASAARGRAIVQGEKGHCIECHSHTEMNQMIMGEGLLFMPGENLDPDQQHSSQEILKRRIGNGDGFLETVAQKLRDGQMPASGEPLKDPQDQADVLNYLKSLATAAP